VGRARISVPPSVSPPFFFKFNNLNFCFRILWSFPPVTADCFFHAIVRACKKIPSHSVSARAREDFSDFSSHRIAIIFWPGPASAR